MELTEAAALITKLLELEKAKKSYGETYDLIQKQVKRILPHSDPEHVPEWLIKKRAPNATNEQVKYVQENWKATTAPVYQQLLTVIERGFIDDNWRIIWKPEQEDMRMYCEEEFPQYGSTEVLVKVMIPPVKYEDANAVLCVRPKGFKYIDRGNGEFVLDDRTPIEPAAYIHESSKVLVRHEDYFVVVSDETSKVEYGGKIVDEGRVMFIYTKDDIFKVTQVGKKIENTYQTTLYFNHGEGVIPCTELKGIPQKTKDGKIIYISPFRYATDLLDLALTNKNYMQLSVSSVFFPFRIMMADACTYANEDGRCDHGKWISNEDGYHKGSCSNCKGSGRNLPPSPLGVYYWEKPEGLAADKPIPFKPIEFVEPPTAAIEFVDKLIDKDTLHAKEILHLEKSNTRVNGSENTTATGMVLNDQGQISFVRANVHQIFALWDWLFKKISFQRYGNYDNVPVLIWPQNFDFRSEADIWEQIKIAREAEAPFSIIQDLFRALLNNMHSSSPDAAKIFDTISDADQLFTMSEIGIASLRASGSVQPWQVTLHNSAIQLVNELMREDQGYLEKDIKERIALLVNLAKSNTFVAETDSNAAVRIALGQS